ncbi:hypothetical protein [Lachnospira sp.]|jgi:hypothetical protein|uniref:hypothetical protein n=1 Tax=Lachnospira sp. TaxID=2049031 RepID=UPI002581004F|nr:hypothetical protein [Lachnospira sp.]
MMFDKDLFLSICEKYDVEFSKIADSPMLREGEVINAHKMAIEALEQELCENSVSKREVIEQAGMTDKQFQGFIRLILKILNNALKKSPDNKDIKNLRDILNDML